MAISLRLVSVIAIVAVAALVTSIALALPRLLAPSSGVGTTTAPSATASIAVPTSPPTSTAETGQPIDFEVAEAYLRERSGSWCSVSAESDIAVVDAWLAEVDSRPLDVNEWLVPGIWLGSADKLVIERGGDLIADRGSYVWIARTGDSGQIYAELARRVLTSESRELWYVPSGSVASLDPSEFQ
jgi:hypothetical protein